MNTQQRHKVLQSVMWDYDISTSEMDKLPEGRIDKVGHYTREKLFVKMLAGLPWFYYYPALASRECKGNANR